MNCLLFLYSLGPFRIIFWPAIFLRTERVSEVRFRKKCEHLKIHPMNFIVHFFNPYSSRKVYLGRLNWIIKVAQPSLKKRKTGPETFSGHIMLLIVPSLHKLFKILLLYVLLLT